MQDQADVDDTIKTTQYLSSAFYGSRVTGEKTPAPSHRGMMRKKIKGGGGRRRRRKRDARRGEKDGGEKRKKTATRETELVIIDAISGKKGKEGGRVGG